MAFTKLEPTGVNTSATFTFNSITANNISTGNLSISTGNINISGNGISKLGPVSNVKITGGNSGYVLQTDGTGNLSWIAPVSATTSNSIPGGSNTQVQFNDAGTLRGIAGFVFDKTSNTLTTGSFIGDGTGLTNIQGINVIGNVSGANKAGTVTTNAQPNITTLGTLLSLNVGGKSNLGSAGNVSMSGGLSGQVLQTDGKGNLSWVDQSVGAGGIAVDNITNGTSNVLVYPSGNVTISVSGTSNVLTVASNGISVVGNLSIPVANVKISGGLNGYVLMTNGAGNLAWAPAPTSTTLSNAQIAVGMIYPNTGNTTAYTSYSNTQIMHVVGSASVIRATATSVFLDKNTYAGGFVDVVANLSVGSNITAPNAVITSGVYANAHYANFVYPNTGNTTAYTNYSNTQIMHVVGSAAVIRATTTSVFLDKNTYAGSFLDVSANLSVGANITAPNAVITNGVYANNHYANSIYPNTGNTTAYTNYSNTQIMHVVGSAAVIRATTTSVFLDKNTYAGSFLDVGANLSVGTGGTFGGNVSSNNMLATNGIYANAWYANSIYPNTGYTSTYSSYGNSQIMHVVGGSSVIRATTTSVFLDKNTYAGSFLDVGANLSVGTGGTFGGNVSSNNTLATNGIYGNAHYANFVYPNTGNTTTYTNYSNTQIMHVVGSASAVRATTTSVFLDKNTYAGSFLDVGANLSVGTGGTFGGNVSSNNMLATNGMYANAWYANSIYPNTGNTVTYSNYSNTQIMHVVGSTTTIRATTTSVFLDKNTYAGSFLDVAANLSVGTGGTFGGNVSSNNTLATNGMYANAHYANFVYPNTGNTVTYSNYSNTQIMHVVGSATAFRATTTSVFLDKNTYAGSFLDVAANLSVGTSGTFGGNVSSNNTLATNGMYANAHYANFVYPNTGNTTAYTNYSNTQIMHVVGSATAFRATTSSVFLDKNTYAAGFVDIGANLSVATTVSGQLRTTTAVPLTATSGGTKGDIACDATYFYVCVSTNTWKRVALASW